MKLPKHTVILVGSLHCDNLLDPITVRLKILNSIVQLSTMEEICPSHPQLLPLAEIMFHPMNPILKVECAFFVITQKDGTLIDATSVAEEDIIKMCVKMSHTHPLGVLHYSVMESVALFCSTEDMQHATCRAIKVMELQGEAIAIRAVAPSETHVSSKLLSPPSEEEGEPHSPPYNPHPSGETLCHLQAELGNLADHELHQLVEDLHQKITLHELNAPPRSPPPMLWGNPSGSGKAKEGNQEVTFPRGRVGFPRDNHPHLLNLYHQMEDGFLRDHPHKPHFLLNQIQTWGA